MKDPKLCVCTVGPRRPIPLLPGYAPRIIAEWVRDYEVTYVVDEDGQLRVMWARPR